MTEFRRFFVGIDPGKAGGIAVLDHLGLMQRIDKMPETDRDLLDLCQTINGAHLLGDRTVGLSVVVERVSSSPQMGVVSAFTFGKGYGALLMALAASRMPFDLVSPVTWQSAMGCRTAGDKNVSKRRAQQLFPSVKVTHAIADALLLAEYCRRYWRVGDPREKRTDGEEGSPAADGKSGSAIRRIQEQDERGDEESRERFRENFEESIRGIGSKLETIARSTCTRVARHGAGPKPRTR